MAQGLVGLAYPNTCTLFATLSILTRSVTSAAMEGTGLQIVATAATINFTILTIGNAKAVLTFEAQRANNLLARCGCRATKKQSTTEPKETTDHNNKTNHHADQSQEQGGLNDRCSRIEEEWSPGWPPHRQKRRPHPIHPTIGRYGPSLRSEEGRFGYIGIFQNSEYTHHSESSCLSLQSGGRQSGSLSLPRMGGAEILCGYVFLRGVGL